MGSTEAGILWVIIAGTTTLIGLLWNKLSIKDEEIIDYFEDEIDRILRSFAIYVKGQDELSTVDLNIKIKETQKEINPYSLALENLEKNDKKLALFIIVFITGALVFTMFLLADINNDIVVLCLFISLFLFYVALLLGAEITRNGIKNKRLYLKLYREKRQQEKIEIKKEGKEESDQMKFGFKRIGDRSKN